MGCGTGVLTAEILARCDPRSIAWFGLSEGFLDHAARHQSDPRASFAVAGAQALPRPDASADIVTSGLVLNFVPNPVAGLHDMQRVLRPDGLLTFYVWDYPGGGMAGIDAFWRAAERLDPEASRLNESTRFPMCTKAGLKALCAEAGLDGAEVSGIQKTTSFPYFYAFWEPFTFGAGTALGYAASLSEDERGELKSELRRQVGGVGPVSLPARAWAVKARVPG